MVLGIWDRKHTFLEMKTGRLYKDILCEFYLTFVLMFAVMMSAISFPSRPGNVFVANIIGFYVVALIEGYAHVELCVMNPNMSFMFILNKTISVPKGILFCLAQLGGALCATLMIFNITPEDARSGLSASGPRENVSDVGNWIGECLAVTNLGGVVLGSGDGDKKRVMLPNLAIGFMVLSVCVAGAPWGISLNPAVAFGFCYITNDWRRYWIYCTAGAAGVIISLLLYHFISADHGFFGGKTAALGRFPSMNMEISRQVSRISLADGLVRMDSISDTINRINQREMQDTGFHGNGLQNGFTVNQSTTDIRL